MQTGPNGNRTLVLVLGKGFFLQLFFVLDSIPYTIQLNMRVLLANLIQNALSHITKYKWKDFAGQISSAVCPDPMFNILFNQITNMCRISREDFRL